MKKLTAHFFVFANGNEPVREWLLDLSKEDRKIIGIDIKTVEFGWPIGMPVCRPLGKGLYEVRSTLSSNRISRVIFTVHKDLMILLHAFIKKTQSTPNKELAIALKRKGELKL